jgi:hypothetical protein
METCFSAWGKVVTKATIVVFLASAIAIVMLGLQIRGYETFEDEQNVWTPIGNQSLKNKENVESLFEDATAIRPITVIIEAKQVDGYSNIVTKEAFQEMIDFEQQVLFGTTVTAEIE